MKLFRFLSVAVILPNIWVGCFAQAPVKAVPPDRSASADFPQVQMVSTGNEIFLPGPLRPFLRMAGISQQISRDEVLPLLAHNIFSMGYQNGHSTEYLTLLSRYVRQGRELVALAGPGGVITVANCDQVAPLLQVLGYRLRQGCGNSATSLQTADADRAFLTIDSGFPLTELELCLQKGNPFAYSFSSARVPVLFNPKDWASASQAHLGQGHHGKNAGDFLDVLLRDPTLARLYWALSRTSNETASALRETHGLKRLLPVAGTLDFYGSHISIQSGKVMVPGGPDAEAGWKDLVGASPDTGGEFAFRLIERDNGWLAAYYDAFSRTSREQQQHFADAHRLKRCYQAFRSVDPGANAAAAVFRPAPALLLLLTRLTWESNGDPYLPGDFDTWKEIVRQKSGSKIVRQWATQTGQWKQPEQFLEAMFAFSRVQSDSTPLQMYLTLCELDRARDVAHRLRPQTLRLLSENFAQFSGQYLLFSEFPQLDDDSIAAFLKAALYISAVRDHTVRGNAMGLFQADVGLWQILARQEEIPGPKLNQSFHEVTAPFEGVATSWQVFDAGYHSLNALMAAAGRPDYAQDDVVDLLAGPPQEAPEARRLHDQMQSNIRSILEGQRLVSLDTILALAAGLTEKARGEKVNEAILLPLAHELREFQMPQPIFSSGERSKWAAGIYNNRHTDLQMRTDLAKIIKAPESREQLLEAKGQLSSFLRDTLVGLNYAYYEPSGAQVLHNNPLFVRSHDFAGDTVVGVEHLWQTSQLFGVGSPAGGGAHLVGSLANLPYVLAEVEENFLSPNNVQALIWREMAPGLITNATLPRWWAVNPYELHAVALYQENGEEMLTAAMHDDELRKRVISILAGRVEPARLEKIERQLRNGDTEEVFLSVLPADTFYLTAEYSKKFPADEKMGPAGQELRELSRRHTTDISWEKLSRDFGVPHPILAATYKKELLNVELFPALEGYSSRLLAESMDSCNLFWARLADEMGYSPVMLNRLVPELTERMVENIFGTDLEDWPAVVRAMDQTGKEFRQGKIASISPVSAPQP